MEAEMVFAEEPPPSSLGERVLKLSAASMEKLQALVTLAHGMGPNGRAWLGEVVTALHKAEYVAFVKD